MSAVDASSAETVEEAARHMLRGCALFGTLGFLPDSEEAAAAAAELQDNTPEEAELLAVLEAKALLHRESREAPVAASPSALSVQDTAVSIPASPVDSQEPKDDAPRARALTIPASPNPGGRGLSGSRRSSMAVSPIPVSTPSPSSRRSTMSSVRPLDTGRSRHSRSSLCPPSGTNQKRPLSRTESPTGSADDARSSEAPVTAHGSMVVSGHPLQHLWAGAHAPQVSQSQQPMQGMAGVWNPWHQFYGQGMYGTGMYNTGNEQGFGGYSHMADQSAPPDFVDADVSGDKESDDAEDSLASPPSSPRLPRSSRDSFGPSSPGENTTPRKKGSLFRRAVVGLKKASVLGSMFGSAAKGGHGAELTGGTTEDVEGQEIQGEDHQEASTGSLPKAPPKPPSRGSRPGAPPQAPRRRLVRKPQPVPVPAAEDLFICGELGPLPSAGLSSPPLAAVDDDLAEAPEQAREEVAKLASGMASGSIPRVQSSGKLQSLELLRCLEDGPGVLSRIGSRPGLSRPGTGRPGSGRPGTASSASIGPSSARGRSRGGKKVAAPLNPGLRALLDANVVTGPSPRRPGTGGASARGQPRAETYQEPLPPRASTAGTAQPASNSLEMDKWQRLREESWDCSTQPQSDLMREVLAAHSQAARKPGSRSRALPHNASQDLPMFDQRLQELCGEAIGLDPASAHWPPIVPPSRPGTTGGDGRATSSSGSRKPKPAGLGALARSLKAGSDSFVLDTLSPSKILRDSADWYGSRLHSSYLKAASSTEGAAAALALALAGLHEELATLAASVASGLAAPELPELLGAAGSPSAAAAATESLVDALGADTPAPWLRLRALVDRLWEELQVPEFERQLWAAGEIFPRDRAEALAAASHALELVAYRGSALRLVHGLCERDRALALLGPEPPKGAEAMHMRRLDSALLQGVSAWCQRFGHLSPAAPACQGRAVVFMWNGQDVATEILRANSSATETEAGDMERQPATVASSVSSPQPRQIRQTRAHRSSSEMARGPSASYPVRVA